MRLRIKKITYLNNLNSYTVESLNKGPFAGSNNDANWEWEADFDTFADAMKYLSKLQVVEEEVVYDSFKS